MSTIPREWLTFFIRRPCMSPHNSKVKQMTLMGLMTAVLCVLAPISLTLPISPVPISLGNMVVCFAVAVLGMKQGCICVLLYLLLGLAGLPVFSNFTGGAGKLLGPTGGYLIGYLFLAIFFGIFMERFHNRPATNAFGAFLGMLALYLLGTLWLMFQMNLDFITALWTGVLPYLPLDILKIVIAILAGIQLRKRLLRAGLV